MRNKIYKKKSVSSVFSVLIVLTVLTSCVKNDDWVQFRGKDGRGESSSRIRPPLGVRWKIKLQETDEIIDHLNPPVVMGDTIYFGSYDGNFYALDANSGFMRWVFKSGAEINSIPYADKEKVYFGSKDGKLYALSRDTGEEVWSFRAQGQINSTVQRYKDSVIFVGDADAIYFLSPEGREQFRINNPGWYHFSFIVTDDVFYNATGPQTRFVGPYDINTRVFLWWLPYDEMRAQWYSFSAIRGDNLYMATADGYNGTELAFYAFNRHNGRMVWRQRTAGIFSFFDEEAEYWYFLRNTELIDFMAPAVWKDLVIYTGGDSVARAFDAETGAIRWQQRFNFPLSCPSTIASGRVYFGVMGNDLIPPKLVCLSARDGRLLWDMEIEGSILSAPVIAGKRIVFGTDKSIFYVLEQVF